MAGDEDNSVASTSSSLDFGAPPVTLEEGDQLLELCHSEVLAAYKRVDRKVKPVPGVFPEDARVERRFPTNPLNSYLRYPCGHLASHQASN